MRFILSDTARARRLARLLLRELSARGRPTGLAACLETAARIYGYASYVDLKASLSPLCSPFDEDAGAAVADARRERHRAVLRGLGLDAAAVEAILDRTRPTGRGRGPVPVPAAAAGPDRAGMMERLVRRALDERASDIHVEPRADCYAVFFRCLGERRLVHMGPLDEYETVVSMLKDRSRMDLGERRIGQDGGFQIEHEGRYVDLRVATVPNGGGEQVIVRVLDPDRVRPSLDELGITDVAAWKRGITRKNGLCLICGETGSGKTTTLNASVRELDRFGKKIYTSEDPVEYRIPFVGQVSTDSAVGYGFAQAIRNFIDADPDVMVLGEVRDAETARNAVKAAETGHLVIATLHTGNILSALSRLRDLGIPAHELRFILRSVLVQTLVKVTCRACGGAGHEEGEVCRACSGTGHSDRTIVSECTSFATHADVDRAIDMADPGKAGRPGVLRPWTEMVDDGIAKMRRGITTSDELERAFGSWFLERCRALGIDPADYSLASLRAGAAGRRRRLRRRG